MSTIVPTTDIYAGPNDPDGVAYYPEGGDWDDIAKAARERADETMVVNFGPHHPSVHGVLRLVLELEGETVLSCRPGIGFLHTGIEKNMEYKTFTQAVTYCTRMDYCAPLHTEAVYAGAVERLLGIEDQIPERAQQIRVLMLELNRISNHYIAVGVGGFELGGYQPPMLAYRDRDVILDFFEETTGLRMNHEYIRPGGVANDLPANAIARLREIITHIKKTLPDYYKLAKENPIFRARMENVAVLDLAGCMALGVTGPSLRATGLPWDLRKTQPVWGYDTYDFDIPTWDTGCSYGRFRVRMEEMFQSLRIIEQVTERLAKSEGQPVMVADKKIGWPSRLTVGSDGQGNSNAHIRHIMGESMEALIHHFKLVTEGYKVPAGQAYFALESPKGELGCHLVSDGGSRPYRAHFRDPGFNHIQALPALTEGGSVSDIVVAVAALDAVMGGVDR